MKAETSLPHTNAIHLATKNVPIVTPGTTIDQTRKILMTKAGNYEVFDYVYVVGQDKQLKGVLSIQEVFEAPTNLAIEDVMNKTIISVRPHTDQERVAYKALHHPIKAVPVVDKARIFFGVVPHHVLLAIMESEGREDVLRLAGVHNPATYDNILEMNLVKVILHRLPWLLLGLGGGLLAARIIGSFEHTLSQNILLAAFIPLIVYMADAVGTQMEAFIIRDFAVNQSFSFVPYFLRQFLVVVVIGLLLGWALFGFSLLIYHDLHLGIVLGISLLAAVMSSVVTGLLIPFMFTRFKLDPANASGPIATIAQDISSVFIYFVVASWLL